MFFQTREKAVASVESSPADLLSEHEQLLGRQLSELLQDSARPSDLTNACPHVRTRLESRQPLPIKVTFSGIVGDGATYCPARILFRSDAARDRLWSSRRLFDTALASREVARIASVRIVTHDCHCMAACMGLLNDDATPPFPSMNHNEDGVFGVLLAACDPSALFAHVPLGVVHDSHRPARHAGPRALSAAQCRLSELLIALVFRLLSRSDRTVARPIGCVRSAAC